MNKPEFSFSHIGINNDNINECKNMSIFLANMFGLEENEKKNSIFMSKDIEVLKSKGFGKNGHIGFYTPDIKVAMKYLEDKGASFNFESAKLNENGEIILIYLNEEINGFAIHLTSNK